MSQDNLVTRAQTFFLQSFRENPNGPAPKDWPSPGVLKRWLKKKSFRNSLVAIRDALRFQADFHVAAAATAAAQSLHATLQSAVAPDAPTETDAPNLAHRIKPLTDLLRLAHLRHRFTTTTDAATARAATIPTPKPAAGNQGYPDPYTEIIHDFDRLKAFITLRACRGVPGYEKFLVGFPDALESVQRSHAEKRAKGIPLHPHST